MKTMKKLFIAMMALIMVLSVFTPVLADDNGSITITNPETNSSYDIYLMFELESFDAANQTYSYKVTNDWKKFVTEGAGKDYFELNDAGYVTLSDGASLTAAQKETLAQEALDYAKDNSLTPVATLTATHKSATGLELGYYLVDSSLGTLCILTTTAPAATINEKNDIPSVKKEVLSDKDYSNSITEGDTWGSQNSASIGDTVYYKTAINAKVGATGYELHDRMSKGLTLDKNSIVVSVNGTALTAGTDYTVEFDVQDAGETEVCDFIVKFKQSYLDTIKADTTILVEYQATVNADARIAPNENDNITRLKYSNSYTTWAQTITYVFMFDLAKTDKQNVKLEGAKFKLYDAAEGGNEIILVPYQTVNYRVATSEEIAAEGFKAATIEAGSTMITGLESRVYYLEEIEAPAGYNAINGRIKVDLTNGNLAATWENNKYVSGGIQVINETGALLPETGGMGTTLFYVFGTVMVLGAFILLVAKKRMNNSN